MITIVTAPDDVEFDAVRIICVDLTTDQSGMLSSVITSLDLESRLVLYVWNSLSDSTAWFIDKKPKCDFIFYNAESDNQLLVGYLSAQKNSAYFGNLRQIDTLSKNGIISQDLLNNILSKIL
jgi:hypothetical protein